MFCGPQIIRTSFNRHHSSSFPHAKAHGAVQGFGLHPSSHSCKFPLLSLYSRHAFHSYTAHHRSILCRLSLPPLAHLPKKILCCSRPLHPGSTSPQTAHPSKTTSRLHANNQSISPVYPSTVRSRTSLWKTIWPSALPITFLCLSPLRKRTILFAYDMSLIRHTLLRLLTTKPQSRVTPLLRFCLSRRQTEFPPQVSAASSPLSLDPQPSLSSQPSPYQPTFLTTPPILVQLYIDFQKVPSHPPAVNKGIQSSVIRPSNKHEWRAPSPCHGV